ncbi:MAG: hypothetical protein VKL39_06375 [Leptolyngbyaceae bacterium]|nr:hypothetical protein [Leptolyngbyaceae bacterium]
MVRIFDGVVGFPSVNHNLQLLAISGDVSGPQKPAIPFFSR